MSTPPGLILPDSMEPVVAAIGVSAALSLVHVFAGRHIYIPAYPLTGDRDDLEGLIGYPLLRKLAAAMGGQSYSVPQCERMLRARRDAEIIRRSSAGESAAKLASDYALSDRAVRGILAEARVARTAS